MGKAPHSPRKRPPIPSPLRIHSALLLVSLLFGVNFVLVKEILAAVEPRAWALVRLGSATVLLAPLLFLRRRDGRRRWPPLRLYGWLTLAALLGVFLNQALFTVGLSHTTADHSAVINTSIPVVTLLIAVLVGQERFRWSKALSIAIALSGVLTLLRVDELVARWLDAAAGDLGAVWYGDLLTAINASSFACFIVLMRRIQRDEALDATGTTVFCFVAGSVMMTVFAWPELDSESLAAVLRPGIWPLAAVSIVGGTVLTYLLNNWALQYADGSQVTLYIYVQPIVATGLSIAIGRQVPDTRFFTAAVLIGAGLFVESFAAARRRRQRLAVHPARQ